VAFSPTERLLVTAVIAGVGAGVAFVALLLAGTERRSALGIPVLLPTAIAMSLAVAPRTGRIRVRVDDEWIWLVVVAAVLLAILARSRAAPAVVGLLGCWSILVTGVVYSQANRPGPGPRSSSDQPAAHLVLITLDTVRADHFEFVGAGSSIPASTPSLSALARQSVVFEQAFSTSALTGPSHATILSGLDSPSHGIWSNADPVPTEIPWVPEILAANGWRTQGVVSAAVLDASLGYDRGFHSFDSTFERRLARGHPLASFLGFRSHRGSSHSRAGTETTDLIKIPQASRPTFTWVHLYDAHWPYEPSAEAAARHGLSDPTPLHPRLGGQATLLGRRQPNPEQVERGKVLYRAEIDDLDRIVGSLLDKLPNGAAVVVVGDHGESLGEHGPVFSHGSLPHSPQTHVPLMIRSAGWEATTVSETVSLLDLAPTLLDLAGLEPPAEMTGRSLAHRSSRPAVSHIRRRTSGGKERPAVGQSGGVAVRSGRWSAVTVGDAAPVLYDRSVDPLEIAPTPLPPGHQLEGAVEGAVMSAGDWTTGSTKREELDEDTRAMLRSLGYVE